MRAGAHLRERDELERALDGLERIGLVVRGQVIGEPEGELLGAAAGRNDAHASLDEPDVQFGVRLHGVAMHGELAAAAEREAEWRGHHGKRGAAQRHRRVLKPRDAGRDGLPVAAHQRRPLLCEVGAGGEGARVIVADDESHVVSLADAVNRARDHLEHAGAQRVHLAAELEAEHTVAKVDDARLLVLVDHAAIGPARAQRQAMRDGRHRLVPLERRHLLGAAGARVEAVGGVVEQQRRLEAELLDLRAQPVDAERVHYAERTQLPAVSPLERAVYAGDVVRELRRESCRMVRDGRQQLAQEVAVPARQVTDLRQALRHRELQQRVELGRGEPLLRHVFQGVPVERLDVLAALLVEAAARLVAEPAPLDDLVHPGREREVLAGGLRQAGAHVREDVESRQVAGAERGRLGASNEVAGEPIHLIDGEIELLHQLEGREHPKDAQPIGHEARHVLAEHDALAERALGELAHCPQRLLRRECRRDELEQVHVARRIEEVRAEELPLERVAAPLEQHGHRDARRVRRHDGVRRDGLETREQCLLGRGLLHDDLDDPVAVGEQLEVVGGVAGDHQRGARGVHECRRLRLAGLLEALLGRRGAIGRGRVIAAGNVEQNHGEAGGGGESGDAAPHDARTDDTDLGDTHRGSCRGPSGCERRRSLGLPRFDGM